MKVIDRVTRNGNLFLVAKSKDGHYYLALTLTGENRVTAWKRMPLQKIKEHYRRVDKV